MKYNILIISFLILIVLSKSAISDNNYIINDDTVYINDSKVYLSATPHTLSSSGWVYFNLTSKVYTGNIDACWGFNTSVSKPKKADVYSPHWVNTTTNHKKTFYNSTFFVYTGDDLNYGNSYNINYKYTITESIVNDNGTTYITSNAAFDSFNTDGTNYTVYWYNRHDNYYLWKDFTSSFNSIVFDYEGYDKWYYIKNVPITSNKEYTIRTWIDVPVKTEKQFGKYYFAIKPSSETISQAVNNGHFYNLDPWWNATWLHRKEIILTGRRSQSFNNPIEDGYIHDTTTYTRYNTTDYIMFGIDELPSTISRGYMEWDISSLPPDANILNVKLKYHGSDNDNYDGHIHEMMDTRPSISGNQDIYNESGEGTIYADVVGFPVVGINKEIDLGNNATSDLQTSIATGWFAIGLQSDNESLGQSISRIYSDDYVLVDPKPTLYIEYFSESEGGLTDYQLLLNVTYDSDMQNDFDDLRFTNETHELNSWLESKVNASYALIWVEFPTTPVNGANQTYYMYYGNAGAASAWDIGATFLFGDDFVDGDYTSDPSWTVRTGSWSATNYYLETLAQADRITAANTNAYGVWEFKHQFSGGDVGHSDVIIFGLTGDTTSSMWSNGNGYFIFASYMENCVDLYKVTAGSSTRIIAGSFTHDTSWHTYKITRDSNGDFEIFVDDVSKGNVTDNTHTTSTYINLEHYRKYNGFKRFDNIFIRKYAANPPTYTFSSEEHYIPEGPTTIIEETGLIMSEITTELKSINMSNYLVYAFILIGILLIILGIQIITNNIYRG